MIENISELTLPVSGLPAQKVVEKSNKNTGQDFYSQTKRELSCELIAHLYCVRDAAATTCLFFSLRTSFPPLKLSEARKGEGMEINTFLGGFITVLM